jgi:hypothetical protein
VARITQADAAETSPRRQMFRNVQQIFLPRGLCLSKTKEAVEWHHPEMIQANPRGAVEAS